MTIGKAPNTMTGEKYDLELSYWIQRLQGYPVPSAFQINIGVREYEPGLHTEKLPAALSQNLLKVSNNSLIGTYILLLSGIKYLLSIYTRNEDILVGMPHFSSQPQKPNHLIPLRTLLDLEGSGMQVLNQVKQTVVEADKHPNISYERLIHSLNQTEGNELSSDMHTVVLLKNVHHTTEWDLSKTDIIFLFHVVDLSIEVDVKYNRHTYTEDTIKRIVSQFSRGLHSMLNDLHVPVFQNSVLAEQEEQIILKKFNEPATESSYPLDKTISELFEAQVEKTPDNIAVVFEEESLTYRELNARANQLARVLREKGMQPDSLVGVMVERSLEMLVGIFAVLKAGGAYVPIDPAYPEERIRYMLEDADLRCVLTQPKWSETITATDAIDILLLSEET